MKLLTIAIAGYIIGLLTFYLCATFNTYAWDIAYFGWSKLFDAGLLFWGILYYSGGLQIKKVVKWVYYFAWIRFIEDIQSFFTGIGVNNEICIAVLFLILISVTGYLCLRPEGRSAKWLNKHLFKSD